MLNDHAIALNNSRGEWQTAVLTHLLNGECVSLLSSPSCKLLARDSPSMIHLSHLLRSLLLAAYQNKLIPLEIFVLSCATIGLHAATAAPGRELQSKLQQQLRHWGPLIECQDMFCVVNRLELLGIGSLSELASLHGIEADFSTKDNTRDMIVRHIVTGACDNGAGELCASVRSTSVVGSDQRKPINLQSHVLDGISKPRTGKYFHASSVYSVSPILPQIPSRFFDPCCESCPRVGPCIVSERGRVTTRRQVDEHRFPLRHPGNLATSGYISYWFRDLRPALRGTFKTDNTERFRACFLLSLNNDNHVPLYMAAFVRDICSKVWERANLTVEPDVIAFCIDSGLVCGYIQFRTESLRSVLDWVIEHATLWLIDLYGPAYFETNSTAIGHHTIKAWQAIIHSTVEYVFLCSYSPRPLLTTRSKTARISWLKLAPIIYCENDL